MHDACIALQQKKPRNLRLAPILTYYQIVIEERVIDLVEATRATHPSTILLATLLIGLVMIWFARNIVRLVIATVLLVGLTVGIMPGGVPMVNEVRAQETWQERSSCAKELVSDIDYLIGFGAVNCFEELDDVEQS